MTLKQILTVLNLIDYVKEKLSDRQFVDTMHRVAHVLASRALQVGRLQVRGLRFVVYGLRGLKFVFVSLW
jgi:hypothetical protein